MPIVTKLLSLLAGTAKPTQPLVPDPLVELAPELRRELGLLIRGALENCRAHSEDLRPRIVGLEIAFSPSIDGVNDVDVRYRLQNAPRGQSLPSGRIMALLAPSLN